MPQRSQLHDLSVQLHITLTTKQTEMVFEQRKCTNLAY